MIHSAVQSSIWKLNSFCPKRHQFPQVCRQLATSSLCWLWLRQSLARHQIIKTLNNNKDEDEDKEDNEDKDGSEKEDEYKDGMNMNMKIKMKVKMKVED